ncbi:MAG: GH1 family beta-glucosidase [Bacteroidota bacterium]
MLQGVPYTKADFGADFKWGVASAAYQIEGAWNVDGKSPSIWDTFTHEKGNVLNNDTGDVACEFYTRYPQDIPTAASLNVDAFRFSLAWTRILPEGTGNVNHRGLDFYKRVVDTCLENSLEPWVTIYHWDLPQILQDKGGWANRDVIGWFSEYTDVVTRALGDRVKHWMIFNEPAAFVSLGYMLGMHAPGKKSLGKFLKATHYVNLSMAEGGRIARANVEQGKIGSTWSCSHVEPKDPDNPRDLRSVRRMDALLNRLFIEPSLGLGYPTDGFSLLRRIEKLHEPGDEQKLLFDFDFYGLQNYFRAVVKHALFPPFVWTKQVEADELDTDVKTTEMGWEVFPPGIYRILMQFHERYNLPKIIVTENGAAFPDRVEDGRVHDKDRVQYYQDYIGQVLRAKRAGAPIEGYFAWTFMDNFEWAEGYHPRFGLVHVNYDTQQRIVKDSGRWFRAFLGE